MLVEALFTSFKPGFEMFEPDFDDGVYGATLINGSYVIWSPCDFPACLLDVVRLSVVLGDGDGRIHPLRSCSWGWRKFLVIW